MLVLELEEIVLGCGVRRPGHPLKACLQRRLTLLVFPLAFQVRCGRELLRDSDLS